MTIYCSQGGLVSGTQQSITVSPNEYFDSPKTVWLKNDLPDIVRQAILVAKAIIVLDLQCKPNEEVSIVDLGYVYKVSYQWNEN